MKTLLLTFLLVVFAYSFIYSQEAKIKLSIAEIEKTVNSEDTLVVKFGIKNTGNRDLTWTASRYAEPVYFEKEDFADCTQAENQDWVTPNIKITRDDDQGIFNIAENSSYNHGDDPTYTLWIFGETGIHPFVDYEYWRDAIEGFPPGMIHKKMSVYLEDEKEFLNWEFHNWTGGGNGGGFSYTRSGMPYWLDVMDTLGSVSVLQTDSISFMFDTRGMRAGDYLAYINLETNDPSNPVVSIPLTLHVLGTPKAIVNENPIAFNDTYMGGSNIEQLEIFNDSLGTLKILDINSSTGVFLTSDTTYSVGAYNTFMLNISFEPLADSTYNDTLIIVTNDPANDTLMVPVTGTGIVASKLELVYTPLNATIATDDSLEFTVSIANIGEANLDWEMDFYLDSSVYFEKKDYVDFHDPANQDRITADVWITRDNQKGIFNIAQEPEYNKSTNASPIGTLWYNTKTQQALGNTYDTWYNATSIPPDFDVTNSLYLPRENRYFDLTFHRWTGGGNGGGFAYTRQEVATWLKPREFSGTFTKDSTYNDTILIDGAGLVAGTYHAFIVLSTNDPLQTKQMLPVTLTVTGTPKISAIDDSVHFIKTYAGGIDSLTVTIENQGTELLEVTGITSNSGEFSAETFSLEPNYEHELTVYFSPSNTGLLKDTLVLTNNSLSEPMFKFPVSGTGATPPTMEISIASITDTLQIDSTDTRQIVIKNTGSDTLLWNLDFYESDWVSFTLKDYAEPSLEENQDRISDELWLTGEDAQLINYKYETNANFDSPIGTVWAEGKSILHSSLPYDYFYNYSNNIENGSTATYSAHLITENRYFDFVFSDFYDGYSSFRYTYTRREVPSWLGTDKIMGALANGESDTITISLNTLGKIAGLYESQIIVETNIPGKEPTISTATLRVLGIPEIATNTNEIDFGSQQQGITNKLNFQIENTGTDTLKISDIAHNLPEFWVDVTSINIAPLKSADITAYFKACAVQAYKDTLYISSNDTANSLFKISLAGVGTAAPDIDLSTTQVTDALYAEDVVSYNFTITNLGDVDLEWYIEGYPVTFAKAAYADWTIPENYDSITPNVKIARQNTKGLYNIAQESAYVATSPEGTEWAFGYTSQLKPNDYKNWIEAVNNNPQSMIDSNISVHLIADDLYFDLLFQTYAGGNTGGGFSYTRQAFPAHYAASLEGDTLTKDESVVLTITFDASKAPVGMYKDSLKLITNDPDESTVYLVFDLDITSLMLENPIPDMFISENTMDTTISLTDVFSTAKIDSVASYLVISADTTIAKTSYNSGNLTVYGIAPGMTTITVRAETSRGEVLYDDFDVEINISPELTNPIADKIENEGFSTLNIDIASVFTDVDSDLTLSIEVSDASVATAVLAGTSLTITEVGIGHTNIKLWANDMVNIPISDEFKFTINDIPDIANPITDVVVNEGFATEVIDISNVFADSDNAPTLSVVSSDEAVVTVALNGSILTVTELGLGIATITLTANDQIAEPVSDEFTFTVNDIPDLANPIADMIVNEGFTSEAIDISSVFSDSNNTPILSANSSNESVVTVSVSSGILTVTEVGFGVATITLTANDQIAEPVSDEFTFTVNDIPDLANPIADMIVNEGFTSEAIDISSVFSDSNNTPILSANSSNESVVTVSVSSGILTVTEVGFGVATITLTANDQIAEPVSDAFSFTINDIPELANPIADITVDEGFGTKEVDLSNVFSDSDNSITLSATSSNEAVIVVTLSGTTLTLTETGIGVSTITVSATDMISDAVKDSFLVTVNKGIGINDLGNSDFSVYPNPSKGKFTIHATVNTGSYASVQIYDLNGKMIYTGQHVFNDIVLPLNISGLQKGTYIISIITDKKVMKNQLIIQ
jgi:hypothetical protein